MTAGPALAALNARVVNCRRCPRLVAYREWMEFPQPIELGASLLGHAQTLQKDLLVSEAENDVSAAEMPVGQPAFQTLSDAL